MSLKRFRRQIQRAAATGASFLRRPIRGAHLASSLPEVVRAHEFAARLTEPAGRLPVRTAAEQLAAAANPLLAWFAAHKQGPGVWKWLHYFDAYHRHFQKFIGRQVHVVEVGVYSGGSLAMWHHYFGPKCLISGIDIQPECRAYAGESTQIYIGDQADREFWRGFRASAPPIDILIDDGGHEPEMQIVTLEETLPYLRPGGVYLCEDVHGADNRFTTYVQALAEQLNANQKRPRADGLAAEPTPLQRMVRSVHLYPYMAVIERTDVAAAELVAPRHGTQWQPYQ